MSRGKTIKVGSFAPSKSGVYDLQGNVWEWTDDCWNGSHKYARADGSVRGEGSCGERVIKGGAWDSIPKDIRNSARRSMSKTARKKTLGFRIVRVLE